MAGSVRGVGLRIERQFPKALHFWCASHQLHLVIVDSCILPLIRNMMGTTDQVGDLTVCVYNYIYRSILPLPMLLPCLSLHDTPGLSNYKYASGYLRRIDSPEAGSI